MFKPKQVFQPLTKKGYVVIWSLHDLLFERADMTIGTMIYVSVEMLLTHWVLKTLWTLWTLLNRRLFWLCRCIWTLHLLSCFWCRLHCYLFCTVMSGDSGDADGARQCRKNASRNYDHLLAISLKWTLIGDSYCILLLRLIFCKGFLIQHKHKNHQRTR